MDYINRCKELWNLHVDRAIDYFSSQDIIECIQLEIERGATHIMLHDDRFDFNIVYNAPYYNVCLYMVTLPESLPTDYNDPDFQFVYDNLEVYFKININRDISDLQWKSLYNCGSEIIRQEDYKLDLNKLGIADAWI